MQGIDFEGIMKSGFDAVEVIDGSILYSMADMDLWNLMYGWDCESILVLNKDIIVEVEDND